ncbi:MAG: DUF362 domain-containing protein [Candidatus Abyssobacteria bacterium SURF_5]|uniref:DUF362 domain-containing protein n=1 Tax=Abyssobacteria bacterium (strain SURF_5) TaxID=2093360 RepID=A0A3A4ND67_ABYX5|nr:MAG: DUF362 domain-containing protein [Candidatus Abyssubacteria bacterium SURF_5]
MASKVYFMDDRAKAIQDSLVAKMLTVFEAAGLQNIVSPGDIVAIKLHMGEYNNTAYLRPVYARALVDKVKELGGEPMVVDTTTLPYTPFASRITALDHLNTIHRNGYTSACLGCPIIIGDGFLGSDDVRIDLPEGFILKEQYVASAIAMADSMIVLSHFKGHPMGVYGGAIKNIGVGCASKRGKYNLHMGGHPKYGFNARPFYPQLCKGAECPTMTLCNTVCPEDALHVNAEGIVWEEKKCTGCQACFGILVICGVGFIQDDYFDSQAAAMADSALAVMKTFKPGKVGCLSLAIDMSPWCDCVSFSDRSFLPNMGVFASMDPVALDVACLDKATASYGVPGSAAEDKGVMEPGMRKMSPCGSVVGVDEMIQPNTAEKIGLGTKEYELITVPQPENVLPFLPSMKPVGMKLRPLYGLQHVLPEGGFKRMEEVNLEEVRGNGVGIHGKTHSHKAD